MFQQLIESRPRSPRVGLGWGTGVAVLLHGAIAIMLLRSPAPAAPVPPPLLVDQWPVSIPGGGPRARREGIPESLNPQSPSVLPLPLVTLPEIPGTAALSGPGAEPPTAVAAPGASGMGAPVAASLTQEAPELLSAPPPVYPPALREAGIEGTVLVELVVDTTGRVEPGSLEVLHTDHAGFVDPAARSLRRARFRPARMSGRAVRVRVRVPVQFRLRR